MPSLSLVRLSPSNQAAHRESRCPLTGRGSPVKQALIEPLSERELDVLSLYWFTGSGATAAHTLYEQAHSSDWGAPPAVPQGFAVFGADETVRKLVPAPAGAHWTEFPRGGHFPAMEAPARLAADLQAFFGPLQ